MSWGVLIAPGGLDVLCNVLIGDTLLTVCIANSELIKVTVKLKMML